MKYVCAAYILAMSVSLLPCLADEVRGQEERLKETGKDGLGEFKKTPSSSSVEKLSPPKRTSKQAPPRGKGKVYQVTTIQYQGYKELLSTVVFPPFTKEMKKQFAKESREHAQRYGTALPKPEAGTLLKDYLGKHILTPKGITSSEMVGLCLVVREYGLKEQGYWLADLLPDYEAKSKTVKLNVTSAKFGKIKLYGKGKTSAITPRLQSPGKTAPAAAPFAERYFSEEQILGYMSVKKWAPFNYNQLYNDLFNLNSNPDLSVDTKMRYNTPKQMVELDMSVEEDSPWHASLSYDNAATAALKNHQSRLTVKNVNLTKHFDVLSMEASTNYASDRFYGLSGSYYLPYSFFGKDASILALAGWSDLNLDEVAPGVGYESDGWFAGLQQQMNLVASDDYGIDMRLGYIYRDTATKTGTELVKELVMAPVNLGLNYSEYSQDSLWGRNYASYQYVMNLEWLGSDDDAAFEEVREDATAGYSVHRLQAARTQNLFGSDSKWLLYLKMNGQFSNDPLTPSEQMSVGGMNTVRGYGERAAMGDKAYVGSVELRTPLYDRMLFSDYDGKKLPPEQLQLVFFGDYGYAKRLETETIGAETNTLYSVGLGLRFSFADYALLRMDYGFPLVDLEDAPEGANDDHFHMSCLLKF